jgi:hypothetical protein
MHTYVDEAGVFVIPSNKKWAVSCVGALTIRDEDVNDIFTKFSSIKAEWETSGNSEHKGSRLDEWQVRQVVELLSEFPVIFEVTAIDMATQTNSGLTRHRLGQAKKIVERVTDKFHPNLVQDLNDLKRRLEGTPNQLYVQAVCSFELLYRVVQTATLYYAQRYPQALSEFHWFIDAKHQKITPYEDLWAQILMPSLQSKSISEPFIQLIEADYSYFEKYYYESEELPEHLKEAFGDAKPFQGIEIRDIYKKNLSFEQSHMNLGVQLADILTTSVRRAMNGHLQENGWGNIGKLMVQAPRHSQTIQMIDLCSVTQPNYHRQRKPQYWHVLPVVNALAKRMLV